MKKKIFTLLVALSVAASGVSSVYAQGSVKGGNGAQMNNQRTDNKMGGNGMQSAQGKDSRPAGENAKISPQKQNGETGKDKEKEEPTERPDFETDREKEEPSERPDFEIDEEKEEPHEKPDFEIDEEKEEPPEKPDFEIDEEMGVPPERPDFETDEDMEEPPEKPERELSFEDVSKDSWYYDSVSKAYKMGFISGMSDKEFKPESSVTAAQFLAMLYRADGNESEAAKGGNWFDDIIEWAEENDIITSDNGWEFDPTAELTREQMMVILCRYLEYKGYDIDAEGDISEYTDISDISAYALQAVMYLVSNNYISGSGTQLNPQGSLTRAQSAIILVKILEDTGNIKNTEQKIKAENKKGRLDGLEEKKEETSAEETTEETTETTTETEDE